MGEYRGNEYGLPASKPTKPKPPKIRTRPVKTDHHHHSFSDTQPPPPPTRRDLYFSRLATPRKKQAFSSSTVTDTLLGPNIPRPRSLPGPPDLARLERLARPRTPFLQPQLHPTTTEKSTDTAKKEAAATAPTRRHVIDPAVLARLTRPKPVRVPDYSAFQVPFHATAVRKGDSKKVKSGKSRGVGVAGHDVVSAGRHQDRSETMTMTMMENDDDDGSGGDGRAGSDDKLPRRRQQQQENTTDSGDAGKRGSGGSGIIKNSTTTTAEYFLGGITAATSGSSVIVDRRASGGIGGGGGKAAGPAEPTKHTKSANATMVLKNDAVLKSQIFVDMFQIDDSGGGNAATNESKNVQQSIQTDSQQSSPKDIDSSDLRDNDHPVQLKFENIMITSDTDQVSEYYTQDSLQRQQQQMSVTEDNQEYEADFNMNRLSNQADSVTIDSDRQWDLRASTIQPAYGTSTRTSISQGFRDPAPGSFPLSHSLSGNMLESAPEEEDEEKENEDEEIGGNHLDSDDSGGGSGSKGNSNQENGGIGGDSGSGTVGALSTTAIRGSNASILYRSDKSINNSARNSQSQLVAFESTNQERTLKNSDFNENVDDDAVIVDAAATETATTASASQKFGDTRSLRGETISDENITSIHAAKSIAITVTAKKPTNAIVVSQENQADGNLASGNVNNVINEIADESSNNRSTILPLPLPQSRSKEFPTEETANDEHLAALTSKSSLHFNRNDEPENQNNTADGVFTGNMNNELFAAEIAAAATADDATNKVDSSQFPGSQQELLRDEIISSESKTAGDRFSGGNVLMNSRGSVISNSNGENRNFGDSATVAAATSKGEQLVRGDGLSTSLQEYAEEKHQSVTATITSSMAAEIQELSKQQNSAEKLHFLTKDEQ
ncbi:hypothetical protein HK100_003342 [Physocladia obscura]|uniref:Uncharacterized protein n=1 Tax=Physocladia obscura TaxID=109957 RepID=A0AAD5SVT3_9FUNG|nr:hypothetical protein HK100_003342 [Physocladia obscura]